MSLALRKDASRSFVGLSGPHIASKVMLVYMCLCGRVSWFKSRLWSSTDLGQRLSSSTNQQCGLQQLTTSLCLSLPLAKWRQQNLGRQ